ncbi:hypothetical protein [Pseudomonas sp. R5(2019)]|uniref:hypothetical protein n=1 Tax=Pseudomonas sp. R5(2019) TaxID=2697566 RepID=UPI001412E22C|nr:hypothetical protein [Pseudomonas sp. R5(2019)]NBA97406.1 hypothetical protein [Pseudomonas sp. R5(2019)]
MDIKTPRTPEKPDPNAPDHLPSGVALNDADDAEEPEVLPEDPDIAGDDASEEPG